MSPASLFFRPWIRRGLATHAAWTTPGATATVDAAFIVAGSPVTKTLKLRGPGHVVGIDSTLVIRSEPQPDSTGVEPNYFPFVELLSPDLPWRYSPEQVDHDRLGPWLVLIVVTDRPLTTDPSLPLPVIEADPSELPVLKESWAWVHAQTTHEITDDAALAESLALEPEAWLCRLVCPRRLDPLTAYVACVVPAWEDGVQAALNPTAATPGASTARAWTAGPVRLPVYHSWRFQTGQVGDFEDLVRRLAPYEAGAEIGTAALDMSNPGGGLPASATTTWVGPLVSPNFVLPAAADAEVVDVLARRLAVEEDTADDPVVSLPFYGGVPMGADEPSDLPGRLEWMPSPIDLGLPGLPGPTEFGVWVLLKHWTSVLNLDPTARASAGLGTAIVRRGQEALVAACWDEAKDLALADTLVRQTAVAGRVSGVLTARLTSSGDGVLLQAVRPALGRMRAGTGTVLKRIRGGSVPGGLVSGAMRRIARPHGTLGRAVRTGIVPTAARVTTLAAAGTLRFSALAATKTPDGLCLATSEALTGEANVVLGQIGQIALVSRPVRVSITRTAAPRPALSGRTAAGTPFIPATAMFVDRLNTGGAIDLGVLVPAIADTTDECLTTAASDVRAALADPIALAATRLNARVSGIDRLTGGVRGAASATYVPHPALSVADAVTAIDPELLCPGVGTIPSETVSILKVHAPTIEAMLVGTNAELAAELRWREYPTDARQTFVKSFWQAGIDDIPDISTWTAALGANLDPNSGTNLLIFLVRGELIRRYPDAHFYLAKAVWKKDPGTGAAVVPNVREVDTVTAPLEPVFAGVIDAQTRYFAFVQSNREARGEPTAVAGKPGWFLAIEQAPTGPRFGLDASGSGATTSWNDLSWDDIASASHVLIADRPKGEERDGLTWGVDAAQMAAITVQRPARGYLHASAMLPKGP